MAKFKRSNRVGSQTINTASLPDIVFMLLFFFMVVTKMKDSELKLNISVPLASESTKLENKQVVTYMYLGKPQRADIFGTATRIQINDDFKDPESIPQWILEEKKRIPSAYVNLFTVSIKADKNIKMGILNDVKSKLRDANALKIIYSTNMGSRTDLE